MHRNDIKGKYGNVALVILEMLFSFMKSIKTCSIYLLNIKHVQCKLKGGFPLILDVLP